MRFDPRRVVGGLLLAFASMLSFPTVVSAQTSTGGLRVTVTDNTGKPVAGAQVKLSSPDTLQKPSGVTADDGTVRLLGLDPARNYTIEITASGYESLTRDQVAVVSGQNLTLGYVLAPASGAAALDSITVTGRSLAALDTTSATVGTDITLDLTESLPTGRDYQSYLQLVPGVLPSDTGNPASKSGLNYSDIGGVYGTSSDNVYYVDGINVTDPSTGLFGSNLNSEIIQEQRVITGGAPAEFEGGSGLISKVVTKSGGDEYHGSINYYFQNDSLVARDQHQTSGGFSTYDTALTLGGPIVKEQLWFFGSYQLKHRTDDVEDPTTGAALRSVDTDQDLGFLKFSWQATSADRFSATYFNDPYERSGSVEPTIVNNRDRERLQGGDNYRVDYSHAFFAQNLILGGYIYAHEGELSDIAADKSIRNDVAYRIVTTPNATPADLNKGGAGTDFFTFRNRDEYGLNGEYLLSTAFGDHAFKMGIVFSENVYEEDSVIPGGARYRSIDDADSGVTYQEARTSGAWLGQRSVVVSDRLPIANACNDAAPADNAVCLAEMDADSSGTIEEAEVDTLVFDSTAGNPHGEVNAYRIFEVQTQPYEVSSEGQTIFVQDSWTINQWTVNAGLRAERWEHFASTGASIFTFDWEIAPRLSLVYDIAGDGRSKVWGFLGRYYDPVRNNMTDFAGALTGPLLHEQVFVGDRWLTYRIRGGAVQQDAFFAPTTKTPYTDEYLLGYSLTVGEDSTLSFTYTNRKTRDILEDYDLDLYNNTLAGTAFELPLSYFGYTANPGSNFVIATLAGGKRDYEGYEVAWQKHRSNNWQALASYTYNDAQGNSNSDSNADFQGDAVFLDPRAPNMYGPQPGSIKHQIKLAGSYYFPYGLELGGILNLNSGVIHSKTDSIFSRHLPVTVATPYEFGGYTDFWVAEGAVGNYSGPAFATIDMRVKYTHKLPVGQGEVFVDIFNVLNDQSATEEQDLAAGDAFFQFGEASDWVEPRRFYLGARYSF